MVYLYHRASEGKDETACQAHGAAERGHEEVVRLLLTKDGAKPDSKDCGYGQTPLSYVAKNGHVG